MRSPSTKARVEAKKVKYKQPAKKEPLQKKRGAASIALAVSGRQLRSTKKMVKLFNGTKKPHALTSSIQGPISPEADSSGLVWQIAPPGLPGSGATPVPTALKKNADSNFPKTYASLLKWCRENLEELDKIADYARSLEIKLYYLQQRYTEEVANHGTAKERLQTVDQRLHLIDERLGFKEKERQQLWVKLARLRELMKMHGISEEHSSAPHFPRPSVNAA
jgi:hypothetical protein